VRSLLWSRISDWQKSSSMEIYTTASVNLNQFLNNMVMLTNFATALLKSGSFDKVGIFSSVLSPVFSFIFLQQLAEAT